MATGYGYDHVPSMLVPEGDQVFFGTRSGIVYAFDPAKPAISWAYKIDNAMVNTVQPVSRKKLVASTMDGKVVLLRAR